MFSFSKSHINLVISDTLITKMIKWKYTEFIVELLTPIQLYYFILIFYTVAILDLIS